MAPKNRTNNGKLIVHKKKRPYPKKKNILIIGAGAMGITIAVRLHLLHNVRILTRQKPNNLKNKADTKSIYAFPKMSKSPNQSIKKDHAGESIKVELEVPYRNLVETATIPLLNPKESFVPDLVFVLVQAHQVEEALKPLMRFRNQRMRLVFFQNGIGFLEDIIKKLPKKWALIRGSLWLGGYRKSHDHSTLTGLRSVHISNLQNARPVTLRFAAEVLESGQFPARIQKSGKIPWKLQEWRKASANLIINPLCSLYKVPNGSILTDRKMAGLSRQLFEELKKVAKVQHINLTERDFARVLLIAKETAANRNSLLSQLESGVSIDQTELGVLTGKLIEIAKMHGISVPTHEMLYDALKVTRFKKRN